MNGFYCHTCMRSLAELDLWGHAKWYGDHYRCECCGDDIKRDITLEQANRLADLIGGDLFIDCQRGSNSEAPVL